VTAREAITGAAPEPSVTAFSGAETIDLVESWLRAETDLRFGRVRSQAEKLGLAVTRRQFSEAKRRIGITAPTAPHPDHRRARETRPAKPEASDVAHPMASLLPLLPKSERRARQRRGRRPIDLAALSSLSDNLQAIVDGRDRARAAIEEIRRIVEALR
jgi:hypothetical protein